MLVIRNQLKLNLTMPYAFLELDFPFELNFSFNLNVCRMPDSELIGHKWSYWS